jgi:hypothetical protein
MIIVGDDDGERVGLGVGRPGLYDGACVGFLVGKNDGLSVGFGVGKLSLYVG